MNPFKTEIIWQAYQNMTVHPNWQNVQEKQSEKQPKACGNAVGAAESHSSGARISEQNNFYPGILNVGRKPSLYCNIKTLLLKAT